MESDSEGDLTRVAGAAYRTLLATDATRVAQPGYQSLLMSGPQALEAVQPERYKIGDRIGNRYEVIAIHRGSMGVVYATFDHQTRLPRALKTLQQRFAANRRMRELFEAEAATWVHLEKHPFIIRAYIVEMFDGLPYVVTEYIRGSHEMGGDLRSWLGHPQLTLPIAVEMALQIAQGMQHASRKIPGLVHRDLKPANILVDDRGRAMVTDFGLVHVGEAGAGTPAYMAPEQWMGKEADQRSDIYAYGCILYEMFTDHRLFPAESVEEWRGAHLAQTPCPPRLLNSELPQGLEDLVLKCLAKDPGMRPASWDEMTGECAAWFHRLTEKPAVLDFSAYELDLAELCNASYSLYQLDYQSEAIELCDRALAIAPNNLWAWRQKASCLLCQRRYEEAITAYDRMLAIDPSTPDWIKSSALKGLAGKLRIHPHGFSIPRSASVSEARDASRDRRAGELSLSPADGPSGPVQLRPLAGFGSQRLQPAKQPQPPATSPASERHGFWRKLRDKVYRKSP